MKSVAPALVVLALLGGCTADRARGGATPAPSVPTPAATTTAKGPASANAPRRYVALGDSFTIGTGSSAAASFPSRLVTRWGTTELLNVAVNGYRARDVIDEELPKALAFGADFATLAVGANDIVRGDGNVDEYRREVRLILAALGKRIPKCRIVALPQPRWSTSDMGRSFGDVATLDAKIRAFNAALREEALAFGARYIDLSELMNRQADRKMFASDGLHPSAAAYGEWAGAIGEALEREPLKAECP